ncbi:MAG: hypothetical protein ACR2KK_14740 [Acidimicrobiales bacterium]
MRNGTIGSAVRLNVSGRRPGRSGGLFSAGAAFLAACTSGGEERSTPPPPPFSSPPPAGRAANDPNLPVTVSGRLIDRAGPAQGVTVRVQRDPDSSFCFSA